MKKLVTKLLDNICACRDIIGRADIKEISYKLYLFDNVTNEVKRQINKFMDNNGYELDFTCQDLYELSYEIKSLLKSFDDEFDYDSIMKKINEYAVVDDYIIKKETERLAELMTIDKKLRENYKLLSYLAMVLQLWTQALKGV